MKKQDAELIFPKNGKKIRKRKNKTEFTEKARKAIHKRDAEECFFCRQQYHMEIYAGIGGLQVMHVVPRSQMGLGVEENGVLGCPFHHSLLDNGNKGLRPEMLAMLEEYLKGIYPGWSREMVTSAKNGRTGAPKENIKTVPQPVKTGCRGDLDDPPVGFQWLSHDKEDEKEMAVREDCFGYGKNMKRCTILKETYCTKGPCNFYKSQNQHQKEMKAAGQTDQKGKES